MELASTTYNGRLTIDYSSVEGSGSSAGTIRVRNVSIRTVKIGFSCSKFSILKIRGLDRW
jgi:hypothetical protein